MATTMRGALNALSGRENIDKKTGKALYPTARPLIRRAALGDVGNKTVKEDAFKKSDLKSIVPSKPTVKNKTEVFQKPDLKSFMPSKPTASKITVALKDKVPVKANKVPVNKGEAAKSNILTRQESILTVKSIATTEVLGYSSQKIVDPDEEGKQDPQLVYEYLQDIFSYLRDMETKIPIRKDFLEDHGCTPKMRTILINWLVEVHSNFKLCLETLYLCVTIIDRYLQENKEIGRQSLQLVGTTAMFIASKYEEMYTPQLSDFVYICDDTFTQKQILQMEIDILKRLDFNLSRPLPLNFLRRYSKIGRVKPEQHNLAKYILELALLEHEMSAVKPSIQAAAACCLSIAILTHIKDPANVWSPTLVYYTTYKYSDFQSVLIDFAHLLVKDKTSKHKAIHTKYSSASHGKISDSSKLQCSLITKLTSDLSRQK